MKRLFITFLAFISISAQAEVIKCSNPQYEVTVDTTAQTINLTIVGTGEEVIVPKSNYKYRATFDKQYFGSTQGGSIHYIKVVRGDSGINKLTLDDRYARIANLSIDCN